MAARGRPGLMMMLADTDAGSIITAGRSGARWGYRHALLLPLALSFLVLLASRVLPREHTPGRKRRFALGLAAGSVISDRLALGRDRARDLREAAILIEP